MLCDVCKKAEATVHLTQIIDNKMQTVDLCESCSKAKGVDDPTGFSLASILLGLGSTQETGQPISAEEQQCPKCGFTASDFKKSGRLGCAECYNTFAEPLQPLLKSMHKGTKHSGKVPQPKQATIDISERTRKLQTRLDQAIKAENFEEAAVLRDQIKKLKETAGQSEG